MAPKPLGTVKIVKNGRITIPIGFRTQNKWREDNLLMLYDDNGKLIVEKLKIE